MAPILDCFKNGSSKGRGFSRAAPGRLNPGFQPLREAIVFVRLFLKHALPSRQQHEDERRQRPEQSGEQKPEEPALVLPLRQPGVNEHQSFPIPESTAGQSRSDESIGKNIANNPVITPPPNSTSADLSAPGYSSTLITFFRASRRTRMPSRDVDSAGNVALAVFHPLHDARRLAALGAIRALGGVHDLLAICVFAIFAIFSPESVLSGQTPAADHFTGREQHVKAGQKARPARDAHVSSSRPLRERLRLQAGPIGRTLYSPVASPFYMTPSAFPTDGNHGIACTDDPVTYSRSATYQVITGTATIQPQSIDRNRQSGESATCQPESPAI